MAFLRAHFFYTPEAVGPFATSSKRQVDKGSAFLRGQGTSIQLESYPKGGGGTAIPGIGGAVNPNLGSGGLAQFLKLRDQCAAAEPNADPPRVPVIFLTFASANDAGQAVQRTSSQSWLPFILLDVNRANPDGLTLLHEMGHCCGLQHPGVNANLDAAEQDNFMGYGQAKWNENGAIPGEFDERKSCLAWQIFALRSAYFYAA